MLVFTNFVPLIEVKYTMSYAFIGIYIFNITVNILVILFEQVIGMIGIVKQCRQKVLKTKSIRLQSGFKRLSQSMGGD